MCSCALSHVRLDELELSLLARVHEVVGPAGRGDAKAPLRGAVEEIEVAIAHVLGDVRADRAVQGGRRALRDGLTGP